MNFPIPRLTRYLVGSAFTAFAFVVAVVLVAAPSVSAQTPNDNFFIGDVPAQGGTALLTVAGGTIDEFRQAAKAQGFDTVWLTAGGRWIAYSTTAPNFVNGRLIQAFPNGIPKGTSVLVPVHAGPGTAGTTGTDAFLVVADPSAERVYVYGMPSGKLLWDADHTILSAHTGTIVLPDGRLIFLDDHDHELRVLELAAKGGPRDGGAIAFPDRQAWSAVDPDGRYYAGARRDEAKATFSIVDLTTMQRSDFEVDALNKPGEPHIALGGSPLTAYAWVGGELHSYLVADVLAGQAAPRASLEIGGGAHSQVLAHGTNTLYTSLPERLDAVKVNGTAFGVRSEIAWNVGGREGGRNGRMRLSYDGGFIYGSLAASVPAADWAKRVNDVHIADLATGEAKRFELGRGIAGRFALSQPYALFTSIHPDGDHAHLLDVTPGSSTFHQIVSMIPLEALSDGPKAGESSAGTNGRAAAITPNGRWAFVSHGGDGKISIIDTATKSVTGFIETPTPLKGGGYLVAWNTGAPLVDTLGR